MMDHERVRKARLELGISQAALARETRINRTVLSGFETGQLGLKGDCAERLIEFFKQRGVSVIKQRPPRDPKLVEELGWIERQIAAIEQSDHEKGFVGFFFEDGETERQALLALYARQRVLKRALQGKTRADVAASKKAVTQADFLALEYLKLRKKAAASTQ